MSGILKALGIAIVVKSVLSKAANSLTDKIAYSFKNVSLSDVSLFNASVKLKLVITNNTSVSLLIKSSNGRVISGHLNQLINMSQALSLEPGKTVVASFTVKVDNGQLLEQIADQIDSKTVPKLRVKGILVGGLEGKTIQIPVDQVISVV